MIDILFTGGCLTETINMQRSMSRRLSQITAINYFKQILEALVYLEKRYVIHEDLKGITIFSVVFIFTS